MIETENLGRHFGEIKAVDGVTFSAKKGDVLGFLGPNGAGKSTTMKMLSCFLTPSFGRACVGGYDVEKSPKEVRKGLGYLPENAPLYGEMNVFDFLKFITEVRLLKGDKQKSAIGRAIELTSLAAVTHQRIETLSKGYKRRVGLAQAIIHDPGILILDEPTDGLDPNQKHDVRCLIKEMAQEKCIVLSTHILEEVDEVCSRVIIISNGKIVADETPDTLRKQSEKSGAVIVGFRSEVPENAKAALAALSEVKGVAEEVTSTGETNFVLTPSEEGQILYAVVEEAKRQDWPLEKLHVESGRLDEVFRSITQ